MPALRDGVLSGENKNSIIHIRGWWDDWIKNHRGNGGFGWPGTGNKGGHFPTPVKPAPKPTTKAPTPKPPAHTSSGSKGNPGGANGNTAPTSSSGGVKGSPKPSASSSFRASSVTRPSGSQSASTSSSIQLETSLASPNALQGPTPVASTNAYDASQDTLSAAASATSSVVDKEIVPSSGTKFNLASVLVPVVILVLAAGTVVFFVFWLRRRRRRPPPGAIGLHSNETSTLSVVAAPSIEAGNTSTRESVMGGLLLPPRGGPRGIGMEEVVDSRPASLSSSAFGMSNPFADRTGASTTASSPWSSDAGHSTANVAAYMSGLLPQSTLGHSTTGSGNFSTASAQHGHSHRASPTPSYENCLSKDARVAGPSNVSHTRLVYPSFDDMIESEDGHVGLYGAPVASSAGHSLYVEDGRSTRSNRLSQQQTPTSLFFRASQDDRSSLVVPLEAPPLPPKQYAPMSPVTPNSAAPLLGPSGEEWPSPPQIWKRNSAALCPPPNEPLPSLPTASTERSSSPLASMVSTRNSVYGGLADEGGSQTTIVQTASRVSVRPVVLMGVPPKGGRSPTSPSFNGAPLQRSPSVLTSGSLDSTDF